jgi:hypothetical protein
MEKKKKQALKETKEQLQYGKSSKEYTDDNS